MDKKDIIIIGAGALGQEVVWLIEEINDHRNDWNLLGFLDDYAITQRSEILGYPILGKFTDIDRFKNVMPYY